MLDQVYLVQIETNFDTSGASFFINNKNNIILNVTETAQLRLICFDVNCWFSMRYHCNEVFRLFITL